MPVGSELLDEPEPSESRDWTEGPAPDIHKRAGAGMGFTDVMGS